MKKFLTFFWKKSLSSILIISLIIPNIFFIIPPKKAEAAWPTWNFANVIQSIISAGANVPTATATGISAGTNLAHSLKIFVLDGIATAMARMMLRKITAQTVNWINSGFKGNPAFITDPGQFFLDTADTAASQTLLGPNSPLNQLCGPFQPYIRLALVKTYLQDNEPNLSCTFSRIGTNIENFTKDFSQGGWGGWFALTQEDQNNPYGAYSSASRMLSTRTQAQVSKYQKQAEQGNGFLNFERCKQGWTPPARRGFKCKVPGITIGPFPAFGKPGDKDYKPAVPATQGPCLEYEKDIYETDEAGVLQTSGNETLSNVTGQADSCPKETVTPGSVINEQLGKVLGTTVNQLELTNQINQIISALMTQMMSKLFSGVNGGLRSLSRPDSESPSNRSLLEQLQQTVTPEALAHETSTIISNAPDAPPQTKLPTEDEARMAADAEISRYGNAFDITPQGGNTDGSSDNTNDTASNQNTPTTRGREGAGGSRTQ